MCRVINPCLDQRLLDVDTNHLAQYEPGRNLLSIKSLQLRDLRELAFKRYRTLTDPGSSDPPGWKLRQVGQLKFVDFWRHCSAGLIHRLGQIFDCQIPHKLPGLFHIAHRVFVPNAGKTNDRWHIVEGIEEAVGGQVHFPRVTDTGNPANGTRAYDGIEGVMLEAMPLTGFIGMKSFGHVCVISSVWRLRRQRSVQQLRQSCARQ